LVDDLKAIHLRLFKLTECHTLWVRGHVSEVAASFRPDRKNTQWSDLGSYSNVHTIWIDSHGIPTFSKSLNS
jgi:hypothetical protein